MQLLRFIRIAGQLFQGANGNFANSATLAGGTKAVTFAIPYSNAPFVFLQPVAAPPTAGTTVYPTSVTTTGFTITSSSALDARVVNWFAVGAPT